MLGGSLLRAGLPLLDDAVRSGVLEVAPRAVISHVAVAPVIGSALLALGDIGAPAGAHERLRRWGVTHDIGPASASVDPVSRQP